MIRGPAPGRRTRSDSWERMPNPTKKEIAAADSVVLHGGKKSPVMGPASIVDEGS